MAKLSTGTKQTFQAEHGADRDTSLRALADVADDCLRIRRHENRPDVFYFVHPYGLFHDRGQAKTIKEFTDGFQNGARGLRGDLSVVDVFSEEGGAGWFVGFATMEDADDFAKVCRKVDSD